MVTIARTFTNNYLFNHTDKKHAGSTWQVLQEYSIAYRPNARREPRHASGKFLVRGQGTIVETARFMTENPQECMLAFYSSSLEEYVWLPLFNEHNEDMLECCTFIEQTDQGKGSQWGVEGALRVAYRHQNRREPRAAGSPIDYTYDPLVETSRYWSNEKKMCMIEFYSERYGKSMWVPVYDTDGSRMLRCTKHKWQVPCASLLVSGKGSKWKVAKSGWSIGYRSYPNRTPNMHWSGKYLTIDNSPITEELRLWSEDESKCMVGFHSHHCDEICWVPVYSSNGNRFLRCVEEHFNNPLTLELVRKKAREADAIEIAFKPQEKLVSFRPASNGDVRINVYYTTGTVGTCINHPRQGRTQLFRRNVTIKMLVDILSNPRVHTGAGYQRKRSADDEQSALQNHLKRLKEEAETIQIILEESKLKEKREREERERKEREERERKEREEREEREREERERKERERKERDKRGTGAVWVLDHSNHVQKCFSADCTCVATNGDSTIFLYENGTWAFTGGLPKFLHKKINGRQVQLPSPEYVSLGTDNRYYIRFADGKSEFVAPDKMNKAIDNNTSGVKIVSFGADWDDFIVIFNDGAYNSHGVPSKVLNCINSNRNNTVEHVAIGPNGSYYLELSNGRVWWCGIPDDVTNGINMKFVDFGREDYQYFVRY
eukprot:g11908.t1